MWTSAVNVKYRDVTALLPVFVQFWMFTSPVVYPSSLVSGLPISPIWRWAYTLNPIVGIIDNFRAAVLGVPFNWPALATAAIVTLIVFIYASHSFRALESSFADII
jgi:lipopolysaccharide transport system permease protein